MPKQSYFCHCSRRENFPLCLLTFPRHEGSVRRKIIFVARHKSFLPHRRRSLSRKCEHSDLSDAIYDRKIGAGHSTLACFSSFSRRKRLTVILSSRETFMRVRWLSFWALQELAFYPLLTNISDWTRSGISRNQGCFVICAGVIRRNARFSEHFCLKTIKNIIFSNIFFTRRYMIFN